MNTLFSQWLTEQMNNRGWSQADLTGRAGLARGTMSNIMNQNRAPGPDVCNAIAKALKLPPEDVFRAAGLLPPKTESNPTLEEANYLLEQLSEYEQRLVIDFIRVVAERRENYHANSGKPLEQSQQS